MAIPGQVGKDNLDISFKLHSKSDLFDGSSNALTNVKLNIVASASTYGLVFVGSTNSEILVMCTKDLELPTAINQNAPVRKIPLQSPVTQLATNCDGSILAVDTKINGIPHVQLYSVPSFLSPNIQKIREFRVSTDNACSVQLCWNPVINNVLAVCTESGQLCLYSLNDQGIQFHSIDPSLKAKCCCWSPKGKQIVAGFANGKLMQFNMELKPARTIECPAGIFPGGSFDVIAIQWLSTYQFAVVFLSHQQESRPILHILNAPKAGPPQYIVYNDVCYSSSEVRPSKIYLIYIQSWGMLLVASANCIDVSFLRISKPGDIPEWTQEFPNDQYPAELPLTPEKDETYPVGFELETACSNKLLQDDGNSQHPVMPMIHIVSTYGLMCSFYLLNTTKSFVDICSPPRPIDPRIQSLFTVSNVSAAVAAAPAKPTTDETNVFKTPLKTEVAPISHSTPAVPKTNLFGNSASVPSFGTQSNAFSGFAVQPVAISKPTVTTTAQKPQPLLPMPENQAPTQNRTLLPTPTNQPLITVPPTYNPQAAVQSQKQEAAKEILVNEKLSEAEDEQIYMKMIHDETKAFEMELKFLMEKSRSLKVNIGTKEESAEMRRKLEELDELKREATETIESLKSDVQANRLGLTEMFSMVYESKGKCSLSKNDKSIMMVQHQIQDRSIKRTLDGLKKMISQCEMQIHVVVQLLNSQWSDYQDTLSKNKKNKMRVPNLEEIYQTLTKQQEIIYNLCGKLKVLKAKLGICDDVNKLRNANVNATIESLSDSIISMSLIDQVVSEKSKLTEKKHKNLLNYLENREVVTIKPQRPKLPGLNSEIVIEKKIKAMKSLKKVETKKVVPEVKKQPIQVKPTIPATKVQQPSETVYDFTSSIQKSAIFTPVSTSITSKKEELPKSGSFSFSSVPQLNLNQQPQSVAFAAPFSSAAFTSTVKKDEHPVIKPQLPVSNPQAVPAEVKPVSTISNANISVSANFSVALPAKPAAVAAKPAIVSTKESPADDSKPLTSTESTSFTFSLPAKKDTKPVITFGSTPSDGSVSDPVKSAFSFSSAANSFGFGSTPKAADSKTNASSSIFGGSGQVNFGFGDLAKSTESTTASTTTSLFSSTSPPQTVPSSILEVVKGSVSSTSEEPQTVTSSTTSLFGVKNAASGAASTVSDTKSSFSFANLGSSIPTTTESSTPSIFAQKTIEATVPSTTVSTNLPLTVTTCQSLNSSSADSVLQGLNICSPATTTSQSTTNIFSAPIQSSKADSSTIFGNSSFSSSFGGNASSTAVVSTKSSVFASPVSPSTAAPLTSTTTTQAASLFGQSAAQTSSVFGSLDLTGNKSPSTSPPSSNIFSSTLVKPDQSVFGQPSPPSTTTASSTNIFATPPATSSSGGSIFGGSAAPTSQSSVFGGNSQTTSSIFGQTSQPSAFGQTGTSGGSIFGQTQASSGGSSIFAQTTTTASAGITTGGSIFSQSTFSTPPAAAAAGGSIFGGSSTTQTQSQSPFGSSSIFGSSTQPAQQTSSIFGGGSSVFGSTQPSQNSSNIFGASNPSTATSSPFGSSSIFSQNQSNQPTFSGNATFGSSSAFGQSTFGGTGGSIFSQQQNQPVFGGGATFGSPKSNAFGSAVAASPQNSGGNIFEQLGSQQSGNLFGNLAQSTPPQIQQQSTGFSGGAFSNWR